MILLQVLLHQHWILKPKLPYKFQLLKALNMFLDEIRKIICKI